MYGAVILVLVIVSLDFSLVTNTDANTVFLAVFFHAPLVGLKPDYIGDARDYYIICFLVILLIARFTRCTTFFSVIAIRFIQ